MCTTSILRISLLEKGTQLIILKKKTFQKEPYIDSIIECAENEIGPKRVVGSGRIAKK